ncbi:MAG: hypothetical protein ACOC44_14025 [Promethearchaeia archaeon]
MENKKFRALKREKKYKDTAKPTIPKITPIIESTLDWSFTDPMIPKIIATGAKNTPAPYTKISPTEINPKIKDAEANEFFTLLPLSMFYLTRS